MAGDRNHALVFGASGLIGWSAVEQLLSQSKGTFSKVTAVTNRPVNLSESYWPQGCSDCPELQLVSGIDLTRGSGNGLAQVLKDKVRDVEKVSHVFYFVFTSVDDHVQEVVTNRGMLERVVTALDLTAKSLKFVLFPGGTRCYGIYVPGGTFTPPLTEDLVNSLPEDYAKTVVYPVFRDVLSGASSGKGWTWCEVCPDVIVGFTPNGSQFSLALHWAQYLSLYAYNHGVEDSNKGPVEVPFPGNEAAYSAKFTPVSASTIARFAVYASLHPEACRGGKLFNVGDRDTPTTFREIWPSLTAWFGLKGVGPGTAGSGWGPVKPGEYIEEHRSVFTDKGLTRAATSGVGAGSKQLDSVGYWLTFDRQLSLERLRRSGFSEERDPVTGWLESFEMFKEAGLIL